MPQFSFTLTIPTFKKVYYQSNRIAYGKLPQSHQYNFLESHLTKLIRPLNFKFIDWIYEEHNEIDNRLHIHGYATGCDIQHVEELVYDFYNHSRVIGMSISSYKKISDIQESQYDTLNPWLNYIDKHQSEIIYRSKYRQELIDNNNLDFGLEPIYGFKGKNKIVEF